jgi:hypothetical protein
MILPPSRTWLWKKKYWSRIVERRMTVTAHRIMLREWPQRRAGDKSIHPYIGEDLGPQRSGVDS